MARFQRARFCLSPRSRLDCSCRIGNSASSKLSLTGTLDFGLAGIVPGSTFALRWLDFNNSPKFADTLAIDNFALSATFAAAPVPEPSIWAMMILGFAGRRLYDLSPSQDCSARSLTTSKSRMRRPLRAVFCLSPSPLVAGLLNADSGVSVHVGCDRLPAFAGILLFSLS